MPLPHLGIAHPVRVCETCYDERNNQKIVKSPPVPSTISTSTVSQPNRSMQPRSARVEDDDDKDLKLALQMSLEEAKRSGIDTQPVSSRLELPKPVTQPVPAQTDNSEDEDLKAAIAASLRDMENQKTMDYPSVQPISPSPKNSSPPKDNPTTEYQVLS